MHWRKRLIAVLLGFASLSPTYDPASWRFIFPMLKKIFIFLLLAGVTAAFLYGLYLQFANKNITEQTATGVINFPSSDCQPELVPCSVSLAGRQIRFSLPEKVFYLQIFPVQVLLTGFAANEVESVTVRFEMKAMDMGFNRVKLLANDGLWHGRTMLPVCTSGRSDWQALVDVKVKEKTYRAIFSFVVAEKTNS